MSTTGQLLTVLVTINNLIYSQLNLTTNRDLQQRTIAAWSRKHGRSIVMDNGRRNVLRIDLKESREGFCWTCLITKHTATGQDSRFSSQLYDINYKKHQ